MRGRRTLGPGFAGALAIVCLCLASLATPADADQDPPGSCRVMVVSFVRGLGTSKFPPSAASPLNHRLKAIALPGYCFRTYSAYCPWCAHRWVRKQFGAKGRTRLTPVQIAGGPTIITYGYSMGAPTALFFARQLERDGIPIELAVTVDSKGITTGIVPRNVRTAANYYERQLFPFWFGKRDVRPEDPLATHFLGNIVVPHAGHFQIVRSMPVRDLILATVRTVYGRQKELAASFEAGEEGSSADFRDLPLRIPQYRLN
jgi:hypothetical protein